jgi:hypothetical protein
MFHWNRFGPDHLLRNLDGMEMQADFVESRSHGVGGRSDSLGQQVGSLGGRFDRLCQHSDGLRRRFDALAIPTAW